MIASNRFDTSHHIKMRFIFVILTFLPSAPFAFGQTENETANLYNEFDEVFGKSNLELYNGTLHFNTLKPLNDTHRYYLTQQYQKANIQYDGQYYPNIDTKYDLLTDGLVVKLNSANSLLGINLINEKTAWFTIAGKRFVNVEALLSVPDFVDGIYQESIAGKQLALYTKCHKDKIEVVKTDGVYYRFEQSNNYIGHNGNEFFRIKSKRDLTDQFPSQRKLIEDFFKHGTALMKEDEQLFYLTLLKQIDAKLDNAMLK